MRVIYEKPNGERVWANLLVPRGTWVEFDGVVYCVTRVFFHAGLFDTYYTLTMEVVE